MNTILCINGSDSMGHSGIQADIRTIKDLGGYAVTAVTSVTVQNHTSIRAVHELPSALVAGQIRAIYEEVRPNAVKVGMICDPDTIRIVRDEIVGCPHIVCSPVILAANGGCLMSNDAIHAFCHDLLPICSLLMLKCIDAEIILGRRITTDEDMISAAQDLQERGAQWVLLRGGTYLEGHINALLKGPAASDSSTVHQQFFSSVNIEGWQRHGVGGTLSTAIATRLSLGDDIPSAVSHAHDYLRNQVVFTSTDSSVSLRPNDLYNRFLSLLAAHYREAHDVTFYADKLSISTRYLSQITNTVSGQSPKQVIDNYLLKETDQLLMSTSLTIQEISHTLGFSSQMVFAKFYKTKRGYSPTYYRKK